MATKDSIAKRLVQFLGLREFGARVFMWLPLPLSATVYRFMRSATFRDNAKRTNTFEAAFESVDGTNADYLEFGVALRLFAFDSFQELPNAEGDIAVGTMAYEVSVFRRFICKAGVNLQDSLQFQAF